MKLELIENKWLVLRRSAVTWVSLAVSAAVSALMANTSTIYGGLQFLPASVRAPLTIVVMTAVIAGPSILARLVKQPVLQQKIAEKTDA